MAGRSDTSSRLGVGPSTRAAALLLGLALGLTGCTGIPIRLGPGDPADPTVAAPAPDPPTTAAAPADPGGSPARLPPIRLPSGDASTSVTSKPAPSTSEAPDRAPGQVAPSWRTKTLNGRSGSYRYSLKIPVFSGTPSSSEINRRVRASAEDGIRVGRRSARDYDDGWVRLTNDFEVLTNDGRTAQVVLHLDLLVQDAAHSSPFIHTTVVDVATSRPVRLRDVFSNEKQAFARLAPVVEQIADGAGEPVDRSGLAAKEANWAAWQTTTRGMVFYFQDYQLGGHGTREYVVPWPYVEPLMTRKARRLLAPQ